MILWSDFTASKLLHRTFYKFINSFLTLKVIYFIFVFAAESFSAVALDFKSANFVEIYFINRKL